ncbi:MAG: F0F1 ATP synthase subunit B [Gammaproteobacteria bacterium]
MNVTATLFGQMLTFTVLVWFVMRFLWEPVIRMLEDRKKRIADGLAAADRGHHEKELAEKRAKELLVNAKEQAAEIIAQAQRRADEIVEESKDDARAEGQRLVTAAHAEIEQLLNQAKEQLRHQVVGIALTAAEQIVMREVDADEHNRMLEKLVNQL